MSVVMGRGSYSLGSEKFGPDVTIGNYCSIAEGVIFIGAAEHNHQWASTYPFRIKMDLPGAYQDGHPRSKGPIKVGHDVWIGMNALILSGVTIGNGAVIGAGAVISKDVPPYMIVGGNPQKILRPRFLSHVPEEMEKIKWWDWTEDRIKKNVHLLCGNPQLLIEAHAKGQT